MSESSNSQSGGGRHNEAELDDLAERLAKTNKARQLASAQQQAQQPITVQASATSTSQTPARQNTTKTEQAGSNSEIDENSKMGKFGWSEISKTVLPYVFRHDNREKFVSVRIAEQMILNRFLQALPGEVRSCVDVKSFFMTEPEARLFQEINSWHCSEFYGRQGFTRNDLLVKLDDLVEFHQFLEVCHKKLVAKRSSGSDRCGFFRISNESVVPYTTKNGVKMVPLFYFEKCEGDTSEVADLQLTSSQVTDWDLAHIKFCCKVQGIKEKLYDYKSCKVVSLDEVKGYFPQGTSFEDYWPSKGCLSVVETGRRNGTTSRTDWTQRPGGGQRVPPPQQQQQQVVVANSHGQQMTHHQQMTNRGFVRVPDNQVRQLVQAGVLPGGKQVRAQVVQQARPVGQLAGQPLRPGHQVTLRPAFPPVGAAAGQLIRPVGQQMRPADLIGQPIQLRPTAGQTTTRPQIRLATPTAPPPQQQLRMPISAEQVRAVAQQVLLPPVKSDQLGKMRLTAIKEFPSPRDKKAGMADYEFRRLMLLEKIVPCLNVRPTIYQDQLLITLPDFVENFHPDCQVLRAGELMQEDSLKMILYKGNKGHQQVLQAEKKCSLFNPVPLILVKDIMNKVEQIKEAFLKESNNNVTKKAQGDPSGETSQQNTSRMEAMGNGVNVSEVDEPTAKRLKVD
jgi:hypothetical protein